MSYPHILYEVDLAIASRPHRLVKQGLSDRRRRCVFDLVQYRAPAMSRAIVNLSRFTQTQSL